MIFMVIENFRGGDPRPIYERFAAQGRLAPEGLAYVASWVTTDLRRCYQVMECDDRALYTRAQPPGSAQGVRLPARLQMT